MHSLRIEVWKVYLSCIILTVGLRCWCCSPLNHESESLLMTLWNDMIQSYKFNREKIVKNSYATVFQITLYLHSVYLISKITPNCCNPSLLLSINQRS